MVSRRQCVFSSNVACVPWQFLQCTIIAPTSPRRDALTAHGLTQADTSVRAAPSWQERVLLETLAANRHTASGCTPPHGTPNMDTNGYEDHPEQDAKEPPTHSPKVSTSGSPSSPTLPNSGSSSTTCESMRPCIGQLKTKAECPTQRHAISSGQPHRSWGMTSRSHRCNPEGARWATTLRGII